MKNILKAKITPLHPDTRKGGVTNETYLIENENEKYVLRTCKDEETVSLYLKVYEKLKQHDFLPELISSDGTHVLFRYIEGRDCTKEDSLDVAYEVGKIEGIINNTEFEENDYNPDKLFFSSLNLLLERNLINRDKFEILRECYLRNPIELETVLEGYDLVPGNFRLDKNNKLYFVDMHAIKPSLKGRGIAKGFLKWFTRDEERDLFKKGYSSVASIDFLDDIYLNFIYMHHLVANTGNKIRFNLDYSKNLGMLDDFLEGKLK